jgi:hypothetical protein
VKVPIRNSTQRATAMAARRHTAGGSHFYESRVRCAAMHAPRLPLPLLPLLALASLAALGCADGTSNPLNAGNGGSAQGAADSGSDTGTGGGGGVSDGVDPLPRWDWTGIIGTGQSLSVGQAAAFALSTTQPYQNLKLSLGAVMVPPFDPNAEGLSMVPLVEPIRSNRAPCTYPCAYPQNIYGETPHTAMANQISKLVQDNAGEVYTTVHTVVGENGQGMVRLRKGAMPDPMYAAPLSTARAFDATLFEAGAIARLAAAETKTYGMGAIIITHGESDEGSSSYEADLRQLWSDYNADVKAATGQTATFPMLVSQQHSVPASGTTTSALAQWRVGVNNPGNIICSGPKYQYQYDNDGVHMTGVAYDLLGEKYGEVFYERVVLGNDWQPLGPTGAVREGARGVTVTFHVPVAPLVWDETLPPPHQSMTTEWANGRGFELRSGGTRVAIESVAIAGDSVQITAAADLPATALVVAYAQTANAIKRDQGTVRWGLLRDSDAVVGAVTTQPQANFAVAFEMPVQ